MEFLPPPLRGLAPGKKGPQSPTIKEVGTRLTGNQPAKEAVVEMRANFSWEKGPAEIMNLARVLN